MILSHLLKKYNPNVLPGEFVPHLHSLKRHDSL